jgi:hypothetical protein
MPIYAIVSFDFFVVVPELGDYPPINEPLDEAGVRRVDV